MDGESGRWGPEMDDFLPLDVLEASLLEMEQATEPVMTPSEPNVVTEDDRSIFLKTPRYDIFREFRDPHSLRLRGVSFPWEMQPAATYDYYRSSTGWMVFLEADVRAVTVRIRHDNPIFEPSPTLLGRTHSIFASQDPDGYGNLIRTITTEAENGHSPLWAVSLSTYLPQFIRDALSKPYASEYGNAFLTEFGFHFVGDLEKIFEAMKISTSIYGRRS